MSHIRRACWRPFAAGILLLALLPAFCSGQEAKLQIYVRSRAEDPVGKSTVFSLREAIRRSASYELTDNSGAVLQIEIIAADDESGSTMISVVGSVIVTSCGDRHLFLHRLLKVGSEKADWAGKQILVDFDDDWTAAKQEMKRRKCDEGP